MYTPVGHIRIQVTLHVVLLRHETGHVLSMFLILENLRLNVLILMFLYKTYSVLGLENGSVVLVFH